MSRVGLLIVLFFISGFTVAQESVSHPSAVDEASRPFEDGKDYFSYQEPLMLPPREDNRIPIQFFFDYDCRVCSSAQDILELYSQINRDRVALSEYPVATAKARFSAMVFYSLQALNADNVSSALMFETAERNQYIKLTQQENLLTWLEQQGIERNRFLQTYYSEQVKQQVDEAVRLTEDYGVFTFPYVIIDGKYVLTASTLYNDDYALAVLDFLINKKQ
ncbi:thiol:disulfide interchange protein DsbA/DsbL [Aggregatibacter segnis]|uniref:thiol:disulfide interchange protein DsbA/DsbL n=1 Tax=Aggregatibacter segnis TaxID=739 RepID=UPI000D69611F|nr:thiol:disulfide interchange protein DsbA/DsbL [Aggregatibacter segnis]